MSTEQPEPARPPAPTPAAAPATGPADASDGDTAGAVSRVWSLRTVAAAAITAVALSGVGGAALAAAGNGSGQDRMNGRGGFGGPPGFRQQLPQNPQNGQQNGNQVPSQGGQVVPPTTP
jgi:hypothetical protein